jgi:hypothetical protein
MAQSKWLAIIALACVSCSRPEPPSVPATTLFPGDYLREDYVRALQETHSPLKVGKLGGNIMVTARLGEGGLYLQPTDFHSNDYEFVLHPNGTLAPQLETGIKAVWKISDGHDFVLGYRDKPPAKYTFVGDLSRYLRGMTVAGRYSDGSARVYYFGEDGQTNFPDGKARYSVGVDVSALDPLDWFDVASESSKGIKTFGFVERADGLRIYRAIDDPKAYIRYEDRPTFTLHRCCEKCCQ